MFLAGRACTALALTISAVAVPISSAQSASPSERLNSLRTATSLRRNEVKPWHLKLSFVVNDMSGKQQDSGTAEVYWTSEHKQTTEVQSQLLHGGIDETITGANQQTYREVFLVRALIDQMVEPVELLPPADFSIVEHSTKFGPITLNCLELVPNALFSTGGTPIPQYCVDPQSPNVLRITKSSVETTVHNRLGRFQDTNVALDNTIVFGSVVAITGKAETLATADIRTASDEASPKTAAVAGSANDPLTSVPAAVIAGRKIAGGPPEYPVLARMQHISGSVVLNGTIDKTGHVTRLTPIASPDAGLTESSMTAVKKWTYQPYLLNNEPIEVDTTITVNYHLSVR